MITTTRTCDKCKGNIIDGAQMWALTVLYQHGDMVHPNVSSNRACSGAQWCRPCMVLMGVLPNQQDVAPMAVIVPKPTLEDFVREIVRDEIEGSR